MSELVTPQVASTDAIAAIAARVREGGVPATKLVTEAIDRAEAIGPAESGFVTLLRRRAMARAEAIDGMVKAGNDPGPLAGVVFGVASIFDVSGEITTGGSRTRMQAPFASRDAAAIRLLEDAGAILIGTQAMDELGYGFVTMNSVFGTVLNPHDATRVAGGAAGGSAVAVAKGLVPFSIAFDFNGSLRIPAALTGVLGLKPTYGDLPVDGCLPIAESLDVVGVLASDVAGLERVYHILRGGAGVPAPVDEPIRFGRLSSWFDTNMNAEMREALDAFWGKLGRVSLELSHSEIARAAASVIIAAEMANLHRASLERDPGSFEPEVRGRLLAGLVMPADDYLRAQRFRAWVRAWLRHKFEMCDVLFTPAAPGFAPTITNPVMDFDGRQVPARSHLGIYTQPISLMGLPAIVLPLAGDHKMPLGVQLIAAAGREELLLRAARELFDKGLCAVPPLPA